MAALNWGLIQDGGAFESLMHALLYADDPGTILFGRPGKDAGQDGRTSDGTIVYQAKYRQGLAMDGAIQLALQELEKVKQYRQPTHSNHGHWQSAKRWTLVANFSINPNDDAKWQNQVVTAFQRMGLAADYWHIETLEGKLAQHPEVSEVFFGGENRVLVGLKEAHDLLSAECVGSASLETPIVGRSDALGLIKRFAASNEERVLPVIGPGGVGKSRLLYEALVVLSQDGWRVLWGLPGTMAKSSQWFRLLNGAQQTCIALDDPNDPGLLRAVIEQLAAVERRNWRVLVACRTERTEILRRFRTNRKVHKPLALQPLDETTSHALVNACLTDQAPPQWLHAVYRLTRGVPGWLCLVAELAKRNALSNLPSSSDDIAEIYVESCLELLGALQREQVLTVLRWVALWGTLRLEAVGDDQAELRFFAAQGISAAAARALLAALVKSEIVRNWGIDNRLYAVEPLIIRQQILSAWLLRDMSGKYEVSNDGAALVSQLIAGEIPSVESILNTLSHLARSRLAEADTAFFLGPLFTAMASVAREGDVLQQYRVVELVERAGSADPESALDVLASVRENVKSTMTVDAPLWGQQSFTHDDLVARLPWVVFQIAEHAAGPVAAGRFINEFRDLVAVEDAGKLQFGSGKGPRQLLSRLLCDSKQFDAYSRPAHDLVLTQLSSTDAWPFVGLVSECLLNPIKESMDWVGNWTLAISRRPISPGSSEWGLADTVRQKAFAVLRAGGPMEIRALIWRTLCASHHSFHRAVLHGSVKGAAIAAYRDILVNDLQMCVAILKSSPDALTITEATQAREMWSWYLKYGHDAGLVDLARQCEQVYNSLSKWRLHDFFRFDSDEELAPETARIRGLLRAASGPEVFAEFFDEAMRYLNALRQERQDGPDDWRVSDLAYACADLLSLDATTPRNALTSFVVEILSQGRSANRLAWSFAVSACQRHLVAIKNAGEGGIAEKLALLMRLTHAKGRLLWGIYSNVHPESTGVLTGDELDCILAHEGDFSNREWFYILGGFSGVNCDRVQAVVQLRLQALRDNTGEATQCVWRFIQSTRLAALRYGWKPTTSLLRWIIALIVDNRLDGILLGTHDLEWLRDQAEFRLSMKEFAGLIESRIQLEPLPKPSHRFEVVPHDFSAGSWCRFDVLDPTEVQAFNEFCRMALSSSFTAVYWIPKYIAAIDLPGQHAASFVRSYLDENPNLESKALARLAYLASAYPDASLAWADIATPICAAALALPRDDRERIYFGLLRKETGVITSAPGEVANFYVAARNAAMRLRDDEPVNSPLRGYREWALRKAEEELRREGQRVEEDADD